MATIKSCKRWTWHTFGSRSDPSISNHFELLNVNNQVSSSSTEDLRASNGLINDMFHGIGDISLTPAHFRHVTLHTGAERAVRCTETPIRLDLKKPRE